MSLKRLAFTVQIEAPADKVWCTLWEDTSYRQWTSVFSEGSYAVSDWNEGSTIQFLSPGGSGMYSRIEKKLLNRLMSFRHIGEMKGGEEQPVGAAASWTGAMETYSLSEQAAGTELLVEMDVTEAHSGYFHDVFPRALQKVKELAEKDR